MSSDPASADKVGRHFGKIILWSLFLAFAVLSAGCAYNLFAQRAMYREVKRLPRNPQTGVIKGTEAVTLPGRGPNAALLVHGFVGSRIDFNDLGTVLQDRGLTVRLMRLPGHGTFPVEEAVTTNEELLNSVRVEYAALKEKHDQVALIGFSMGGALCTIVASEGGVDRLVLIAPYYGITYRWYYILPARIWNRMFSFLIPYVVKSDVFTCVNRPEAKKELFSYRVISTKGSKNLILLGERARNPEILEKIRCPVLVLQSKGDRAASPDRVEKAFEQIGSEDKRIVWYRKSNHHLLWDYDRKAVKSEIVKFLQPLCTGADSSSAPAAP